jgi:hypothetical protein
LRDTRPQLLLSILLALVASACGNGIAATAGGTKITDAEVTRELGAIGRNTDYVAYLGRTRQAQIKKGGNWTKPFTASVVNQQIDFVALQAIARKQHLPLSSRQVDDAASFAQDDVGGAPIYEKFPSWYRRELRSREALLAGLRVAVVKDVTPQDYYAKNKGQFVRFCTSDIVVKTQDDAERARNQILGGASFADVARAVSLDKGTGPRGGDLGCNGPMDLAPQLNGPASTLKLEEVSAPISSDAGWHLLVVHSRSTPPLDGVQGEVDAAIQSLSEQRVGDELRAWLRTARVSVASRYGRWDSTSEKVVA